MSDLIDVSSPPSHRELPQRPKPWRLFRAAVRYQYFLPFLFIDWLIQWAAYGLSRLSLIPLLEYCSSFSVLIAIIVYFADAPQRTKMRHYEAWQVINSAQGKGGNGGRIDALRELNDDHLSLLGVDVSDAFLQGVQLHQGQLMRANFSGCDMRDADVSASNLSDANLRWTNLVHANLEGAMLSGANLENADISYADLKDAKGWEQIRSMNGASIAGIRNAPAGFVDWAVKHGAVQAK